MNFHISRATQSTVAAPTQLSGSFKSSCPPALIYAGCSVQACTQNPHAMLGILLIYMYARSTTGTRNQCTRIIITRLPVPADQDRSYIPKQSTRSKQINVSPAVAVAPGRLSTMQSKTKEAVHLAHAP